MTFAEAVTLFQTRVEVDTDSDFDSTNTTSCEEAIMRAAYRWSRDTYCLYTWRSALTLSASATEYDTLGGSAITAEAVFDVYGVHINGYWSEEMRGRDFINCYSDYYLASGQATFPHYTRSAPSIIKLPALPSSAAVSATDNFIMGFRLHATYAHSQSGSQLEGPIEMHEMIVDRAYLDNTKSYISSDEAYNRRAIIENDYNTKALKYKSFNLANFKKEQRRAGAGNTRRIYGLGGF